MTKIACPRCNTQAHDDTAVFCYKCGTQLSADIPEKKNTSELNFGMKVLKKDSIGARDDSLLPRKPGVIKRIMPIEICARCGAPVIDKNRIFCTNCTAYVRDISSRGESLIFKHSVLKFLDKKPVIAPEIDKNTEIRTVKEQEPQLILGTSHPLKSKAKGWKLIIILAGIVIFLFMLMLMVMFMFTFWTSLT